MIRRLWRIILRPWRHDRAFGERMHDARCAALEQTRISLRQQRRLRTNLVADDIFDGPPDPDWTKR